jgi:chromosome segregation ATPase
MPQPTEPRMIYKPEVTLGSLLTIGGMLVGVTIYVVAGRNTAENAASTAQEIRTELSTQIQAVKQEQTSQNTALGNKIDAVGNRLQDQIATIPVQTEKLNNLQAAVTAIQGVNEQQNGLIAAQGSALVGVGQEVKDLTGRVQNLESAADSRLPGGHSR